MNLWPFHRRDHAQAAIDARRYAALRMEAALLARKSARQKRSLAAMAGHRTRHRPIVEKMVEMRRAMGLGI